MTRKEFLIIKNITREGPGLIEEALKEGGIAYDVVDLEMNERVPPIEGYSALIVLGGPDSANDRSEKMRSEVALVEHCLELGKPYLGICLGMQVLVKASGGRVLKSDVKEVGFRDENGEPHEITLTEKGVSDPLFDGLGERIAAFQLHGETVELASGMDLLGTGKRCRNQAVRTGQNAYGLQFHFEVTRDMLELWLREDIDLSLLKRERVLEDFARIRRDYELAGLRIAKNFIDLATGKSAQLRKPTDAKSHEERNEFASRP